ncbi:FAD binding domain-containing protein [Whalleya microplaca]|nr:FAD binding domain-containing protein [Whalleya microplaca]
MARSVSPHTWQRGFAERTAGQKPAWADSANYVTEYGNPSHYLCPSEDEKPTSKVGNEYGLSSLRSWPSLYNGTEAQSTTPSWWKPASEVDVLICGAGPFGLEVALGLARDGISFRIIDKAESPCLTGRADAIQPRALEFLHALGVGHEATEEGPLLNKTVLHRNGVKLFHNHSSMCDSRYKGIHTITQGQAEKIYIRDLLRHKVLVERSKTVPDFNVSPNPKESHPVTAKVTNVKTGQEELVKTKYMIGADGAASRIRELIGVPFDGLATDCFWTILDCEFETDYPHILDFSLIINAEHGGSILIPREQGHTRIYVQVTGEKAAKISAARKRNREKSSAVGETEIYDHGITPEEAMEHLNKIASPWKFKFAGPMSWFAVWRVNERVARYWSTPDQRVHIGGDAAHVHSVLGAFGLNSSIYDAVNLSWKLKLCLNGGADPHKLLPTYDTERRLFANRVIRCSGAYLRFICNMNLPLASLRGLGNDLESHDEGLPILDGTTETDRQWLMNFFGRNAMFLLGVDGPVVDTVLSPVLPDKQSEETPVNLRNGARAPSPRVCFRPDYTSYLYDAMLGLTKFHILVFGSDLQGPVRERLAQLSAGLAPGGFFSRFGGRKRFNVVLVVKALPHQAGELLDGPDLQNLRELATVAYDDRAPDEDAHYWYGVNHARGAVVVVRPDLIVGMSTWPEDTRAIEAYFSAFLLEA